MSCYERKYVSSWVPGNIQLLTVLLVAVAVVNSAVRLIPQNDKQTNRRAAHSITLFTTGGLTKVYDESSNRSAIYGTMAVGGDSESEPTSGEKNARQGLSERDSDREWSSDGVGKLAG